MINKVYLGLGSNIGDKEKNLFESIKKISELKDTKVINCSHVYDTKPVAFVKQDNFLNMVVEIDTEMGPYDLLHTLISIEISFNRKREIKWGPRTLDIDILIYGDLKIELPGLIIPHNRMFERAFTLIPLKDIYFKKTIMGKNIDELILKCSDKDGLIIHKKVSDLFKLRYNLKTDIIGRDLLYFEEIDSTNLLAKKMAPLGCKDGLLIISEEQKKGKGRLGRPWASSKYEGIWLSVVLNPKFKRVYKQILPLVAALAVVEGIKKITGIKTSIKWPNDVILAGRKVSGVLCESTVSNNKIDHIIVGIGINVNQQYFNDELKNKAISLNMYAGKTFDRGLITASVLECFEKSYKDIHKYGIKNILARFKENTVTIGSKVRVINQKKEYSATALDINKKGNLIVLNDDGYLEEVLSGEVSVRGVLGYT